MSFGRDEWRKLAIPIALCVVLIGCGAGLIWWTQLELQRARQALAGVQAERAQATQKLARIAEEEREVKDKMEIYKQLRQHHILGPEQRLEWADAMKRIRSARELADLRYRVEQQTQLSSIPGKPGTVDFYASRMKVELALLHEADLFPFLNDLRASGYAYYAIRRCALARSGIPAAAPNLLPRVRADCEIDLITILDRAAKPAAEAKR